MIKFIKENAKDLALTVSVAVIAFVFVMFNQFADAAKHPFAWKFWQVAGPVAGIVVVALWAYAFASDKGRGKY